MRTAKILGFVVGGVIAVVALVLLSVYLFVNPNHYKDKIAAAVKDATGRDLMLQGDIKLSVFPWIALELGPAALGNPPGFGGEPFVAFQHAAVRARLLPLLQERLEVARVEIDDLDVRLEKNAAGKGNWESVSRPDETPSAAAPAAAERKPLEGLAGIKVVNARVRYQNYTLEKFNLETTPFVDGVVPIAVRFDVNRGVPTETANVEIKVDFSNPGAQRYRVAALNVISSIMLANNPRPIRLTVSTPNILVDLGRQTVQVPTLAVNLSGALLNGSIEGSSIVDDPQVSGALTLAPLLLREFMPRLGLTSPATRDPRAFSQLSGAMSFLYGSNAVRLEPLQVTLDDTHLRGAISVTNLATQSVTFDLAADTMDADGYLANTSEPAHAEMTKPATAAAVSAGAAPLASTSSAAASPLLDVHGIFSMGSLHVAKLDLQNLKAVLVAKDGIMRLNPLQAQLYGGHYSGDISVDSRSAVPMVTMDEHLSGVDVAALLASSGNKKTHLSGKGNFEIKATAHGAAADAVLKTLNGHMDANVTGGAVEGIDLGFQLSRAESLLRHQEAPSAADTHRTPFDAFKMSAEITNGIAVTRDLLLSSPVLKVTGQGSAQLATQAIDFSLVADTLHAAQGMQIQLPVKVTGTTADPVIRPDIAALAKGQLKQKVQDVLQDKLKSLFGK